MHVLIDALVLALSYVLSWYCYVRLGVMNNHPERGILPPATYMMALLYIVPGYLLLYYAFNLYASKRFQGRRLEFANIWSGWPAFTWCARFTFPVVCSASSLC